MDSEEAVLQMDLLGHDFYIFTDRETDGTSIVYRRKDGKYGLIETTEQLNVDVLYESLSMRGAMTRIENA